MTDKQELPDCCVTGHLHEGTPEGKEQTLYGLPTYVVGEKVHNKLICTD